MRQSSRFTPVEKQLFFVHFPERRKRSGEMLQLAELARGKQYTIWRAAAIVIAWFPPEATKLLKYEILRIHQGRPHRRDKCTRSQVAAHSAKIAAARRLNNFRQTIRAGISRLSVIIANGFHRERSSCKVALDHSTILTHNVSHVRFPRVVHEGQACLFGDESDQVCEKGATSLSVYVHAGRTRWLFG